MTASPAPVREPVKFAYWVPNVSGGLVVGNVREMEASELERVG
jgi:hypothetical protein